MALTSKLDIDIIPVELAGQNINYEILKDLHNPVMPDGTEVRYSDDFILKLNELYPVSQVFGEDIKKITGRNGTKFTEMYMHKVHIQAHPFLGTLHGRLFLEMIVLHSAAANSWQPFIYDVKHSKKSIAMGTAEEFMKKINDIGDNYRSDLEDGAYVAGLISAKFSKLVIPITYENKVIALPSQRFVNYLSRQK